MRVITALEFQRALRASSLSPKAKLVAWAYSTHGTIGAWSADIEGETGLSRSSVTRAKKELSAAGWLAQTCSGRGGHSTNRDAYDLTIPGGPNVSHGSIAKRHGDALQSVTVTQQMPIEIPLKMPLASPPSGRTDEMAEKWLLEFAARSNSRDRQEIIRAGCAEGFSRGAIGRARVKHELS